MPLEGGHLLERGMSEVSGEIEMFYISAEAMCSWLEAFVKNYQTTFTICVFHCMQITFWLQKKFWSNKKV